LYVSAKEGTTPGEKLISLSVKAGSETVHENLKAFVSEKTGGDSTEDNKELVKWLQIALIVLVVLLVVIGLVIGFSRLSQKKEDESEDESYY